MPENLTCISILIAYHKLNWGGIKMSRVKHAFMIVFKLLFIVLCFAVAAVYTAFAGMDTGALDNMKRELGAEACEILVMDTSFNETGASLSYKIEDGKIVFDLVQSGKEYDEVAVCITFPSYEYDTNGMREYLQETIGDRAKKEEDYLTAMAEGPWNCYYSLVMTGDTEDVSYTIINSDSEEYGVTVQTDDKSEPYRIENIYAEKGDNLSFILCFGSKTYGALPSGRYVFDAKLGVSSLYEGNAELSFGSKISVFTNTCVNALKEQGLNIFNVENWLVFYGAMIVTGMFVYLWRDLRSLKKIFGAMLEERHPPIRVIIKVYVDGYLTDEYSYIDDGTSMIAAFFVALVSYVLFLLTYPIRILIHIVRDIVYLIKEDDEIEGFSILGNILGSVGIYVLLFGIVGLIGTSYLIGAICTVVGLGMCIVAHFICKYFEEEYG